jgi:hypothetical protein
MVTRLRRAKQILKERLEGGACNWPLCSCYSALAEWSEKLSDEERVFPMEMLEWGETSVFISLCCMQAHCCDLEQRIYAAGQLLDPFWERQKAMSIMRQ